MKIEANKDWLFIIFYQFLLFIIVCSHQLGDFASYFHEYVKNPQHRLSVANDTKIKLQYRRVVKNTQDPYKRWAGWDTCCDWC